MTFRRNIATSARGEVSPPPPFRPSQLLSAPEGMERHTGKPYTQPPPWGIRTFEAARLLLMSPRQTRRVLHRFSAGFAVVERGRRRLIYWRKQDVEALARYPLSSVGGTFGLVPTQTAMDILQVERRMLYCYVLRGWLRCYVSRVRTPQGIRTRQLYCRSELRQLAAHLRAVRSRGAGILLPFCRRMREGE